MAIRLINGTAPHGVSVQVWPGKHDEEDTSHVVIDATDITLSLKDLCEMMLYALTSMNLQGPDDPRTAFIERVKELKVMPGFRITHEGVEVNPEATRLALPPRGTNQ